MERGQWPHLSHFGSCLRWWGNLLEFRWYGVINEIQIFSFPNCMFLSCHVRVSKWIHTPYLPQCQRTPCSKQARNLKVKWLQLDSNPEPLSSLMNTQPFGQPGHYKVWIHSETRTWHDKNIQSDLLLVTSWLL